MCLNDPIAVVTVGAQRKIEFFHNYQSPSDSPVLSISPAHGSLYIMASGCQDYFRHRVPADRSCNSIRASFSFRRVVGPTIHDMPANGKITENDAGFLLVLDRSLTGDPFASSSNESGSVQVNPEQSTSSSTEQLVSSEYHVDAIAHNDVSVDSDTSVFTPIQETVCFDVGVGTDDLNSHNTAKTTILFGSSMTKYINQNRLSNSERKFVNISQSGAQLLPRKNRGSNQP